MWKEISSQTICFTFCPFRNQDRHGDYYIKTTTMVLITHDWVHNDLVPARRPHTILIPWYPAVPSFTPTRTKVLGKLKFFDRVQRVSTFPYRANVSWMAIAVLLVCYTVFPNGGLHGITRSSVTAALGIDFSNQTHLPRLDSYNQVEIVLILLPV